VLLYYSIKSDAVRKAVKRANVRENLPPHLPSVYSGASRWSVGGARCILYRQLTVFIVRCSKIVGPSAHTLLLKAVALQMASESGDVTWLVLYERLVARLLNVPTHSKRGDQEGNSKKGQEI
jgi:hypothetical protein